VATPAEILGHVMANGHTAAANIQRILFLLGELGIDPWGTGLPDRIGGGRRRLGPDDADRIRRAWDEIDALRGVAPVAPVAGTGATVARQGAAPAAATTLVLPSGRTATLDHGTRALIAPAEGFTDDDMEAALLALCLLDFDD
jgi:hypothetical protein